VQVLGDLLEGRVEAGALEIGQLGPRRVAPVLDEAPDDVTDRIALAAAGFLDAQDAPAVGERQVAAGPPRSTARPLACTGTSSSRPAA